MSIEQLQKPGIEEWLHWAEVALDRLTDCVHVYKKPPHDDVFMAEAERQDKSAAVVALLHRLHPLIDQSENPSDSIPDAHTHDEQIIDGIAVLFREALALLPGLSADMQKLLKSPWQGKFPNKTAHVIFAGHQDESQGIGSGHAAQGRLPEALAAMLEREQTGDNRRPREALLRHGEPRRHDIETRERWKDGFLRSAGRVE